MSKILLVEDNEMNRDMLCRRLQRRGYGGRNRRPVEGTLGVLTRGVDPVDVVRFFVKAVVAQFVADEEHDQQATRQPHSQPGDVDKRVALVLAQSAQGDFEVVLDHVFGC